MNGPNNFPNSNPPGLQHMSHVPMAPTLSLGVPFSEIESILDRGRGGLTIPHSIRNHFLDQQPGFMFPFQPGPSIPLQNHQQQGMSPGVPVTEIINILNRMRANPSQPRFEPESQDGQSSTQRHKHQSSKNPSNVHKEHIHFQSKSKQSNDDSEFDHSHIHTESKNTHTEEKDSRIASEASKTHTKDTVKRLHSHHRFDSKSVNSKHDDHLNSKADHNERNHLAKSKASLLESILKDTEDKDQEKNTLDQGSKALIKRFKDPIGFHQILNDMDVQISSFPKSIGHYLTNMTNSSTQEELDSSEQMDSLDLGTLQNASVECDKACHTHVQCPYGFLQGVCPRCECAPDPCTDNTCSSNQECIRVPDGECADKNNSLCPQIYICEEIGCGCTNTWEPVCGTDKDAFVRTYINNCTLNCHKVEKVYDGECWSSEVPIFYFSFNDTDDDDDDDSERKNKTRVADSLDPDDIVFEIVNETDVKRPVPVKSLNIYEGDNATTTSEATDLPYVRSIDEVTTTKAIPKTEVPIEATTTTSTTTISDPSIVPETKQETPYSAGRDSKASTKDVDDDLPKKGPYRLGSQNTPKPTKVETTTQNDILLAKQIIEDLERMIELPSIHTLENQHSIDKHGEKNDTVKKVKTDTSFNGRLGLLENDIPRIPKELLYDRQMPQFTSKPKSPTKHSHSGNKSKNLKSIHEDFKHSGNGKTDTKVKTDDDLMFESDDDFTGQDLPKLFQILNEYRHHNKTWTRR